MQVNCFQYTSLIVISLFKLLLTIYVNIVKGRIKPVPLEDFGAHVSRMHADRDKWFEMEYNVSAFITPFFSQYAFLLNFSNEFIIIKCFKIILEFS